jgi:hypothetical protein
LANSLKLAVCGLMSMTTESSPCFAKRRDQPPADKPSAADDQRRHVRFSPFAKRRGGIVGESVVPPRAATQPSAR